MPYILFISYSVYIYPLLLLNKQLAEILNNILNIIKRMKDLQLNIFKMFLTYLEFNTN